MAIGTNTDQSQHIGDLHAAGVPTTALQDMIELDFDLAQAVQFLENGGTVREMLDQIESAKAQQGNSAQQQQGNQASYFDDDEDEASARAGQAAHRGRTNGAGRTRWNRNNQDDQQQQQKQSGGQTYHEKWYDSRRKKLEAHTIEQKRRAELQVIASQAYQSRRGVYTHLDWYREMMGFLATLFMLIIAAVIWRVDAYFTVVAAAPFRPAPDAWPWLDQAAILPLHYLYPALLVPIGITAIQATCFPTLGTITTPQRIIGAVVSFANWVTTATGLGLYLWGEFITAPDATGGPLAIPLVLIGAGLVGLGISLGAEWIISDALPRLVIQIMGIWNVLYHNTQVFFASAPPLELIRTVLSNILGIGVGVLWFMYAPGEWIIPDWQFDWQFLWTVGTGMLTAFLTGVLCSWSFSLLVGAVPSAGSGQTSQASRRR